MYTLYYVCSTKNGRFPDSSHHAADVIVPEAQQQTVTPSFFSFAIEERKLYKGNVPYSERIRAFMTKSEDEQRCKSVPCLKIIRFDIGNGLHHPLRNPGNR